MKKRSMNGAGRALFCMVSVMLSLVLMTTAVFAAAPTMVDEDDYVYWTMSDDGTLLTGDDVTYQLYELPIGYKFQPATAYVFAGACDNGPAAYFNEVMGLSKHSDVVWMTYNEALYVTSQGRARLDAFVGGKVVLHRLKDAQEYEVYSELSDDFMADLAATAAANAGRATDHDVTTLANAKRYDITAWDRYDCVYTVEGALYVLSDGAYGYVDYRTLDNSFFNADGSFSYRKGTVALIPVEGEQAKAVGAALSGAAERLLAETYEDDGYEYEAEFSQAGLLISATFSGILLPIAPLVVGLILPRSKKMGYPKRWYVMSGLSAVWLLVGVIQLILLLTV